MEGGEDSAGFANGYDFGVGGGIIRGGDAIGAFGEDAAVFGDDRAERAAAGAQVVERKGDGSTHKFGGSGWMGGCRHDWSVISAFSLPVSKENRNTLELVPCEAAWSTMESEIIMEVIPIHPGEHLAEELKALDMSAAELARKIEVPTNRITQIMNGTRSVSGDTALRLAHFFGTSAQFWLNLQGLYDLRIAEQKAGKSSKSLPKLKRHELLHA